ncbi:transmembrane protein 69-like [Takifugu rubripes]|uniref:Transmembrane protein 69 n=1 Tax=Takifugu rubripes TaxID=31033 RepID=H2VC97_TAKRU|nr:transmembrane protein 69-like [Takifugu rubripes]XP_056895456.1 transmembrane protein 69-like [Takifugu flavidus]|eukprot:XP_011613377.1 PREDICTED: transmembrane protein 69-like [Takifugu rubripes]
MFSVVLKRTAFAARKLAQWGGIQTRCLTSQGGFRLNGCLASTARRHFPQDCVTLGLKRVELFQLSPAPSLVWSQHVHSSAVRFKKRAQPEPPPRELDLLRYDMRDLWKSPKPALTLGFAGLIPFVTPVLIMGVREIYCPELAYAQLAYGASILSFLGGARWGFALPESSPAQPDWINLANSVIPSLLAWMTMLMSDSVTPALTMLIMGLGISLHYDLSLLPTYPSWFKALRAVLTTVAFFSLVGTLIVSQLYPEKKLFWD